MYIPVANSLVCRPKLDLNVYCVQKRQANVTSTTQGFVGDVDDGINRKALAGLIVATLCLILIILLYHYVGHRQRPLSMISNASEASEISKKINKQNRTCTWPWRSTSLQKQVIDTKGEKGEVIATPSPPPPVFPTPSRPRRSGKVFPRALHLDIPAAQAYGSNHFSKYSPRHKRASRRYMRIVSMEEPITFEPLLLRDTDAPFLSPSQRKKVSDNREYDQWSSPNEAKHFPQDIGDDEPDCLTESPMNLSEKDIEQPSSALAPPPSPWKTRTEFSLHSPMTPWSTTSLDSSATLIPSPSPASFKTQRPSPLQQAYLKEGIRSQQRKREASVYGPVMHGVSGGMEGGGFGSVLRASAVGEVHGRLEDRKHERGENEGSTQKRRDSEDENPFVIGDSESEE